MYSRCAFIDGLPALRNEGDFERPEPLGDGEHLVGARHLEIEDSRNRGCELLDVGVLNVPPILAQVRRDSVGAGLFAQHRRRDWIRFVSTPGLPYRGHVIDVDVQPLVLEHD